MQDTGYDNKAIFAHAVMEIRETLFRVAYSILRNQTDCEDAVAEALVKAYEHVDNLRDRSLFKPWLIRIVKNECFILLRKRKRTVSSESLPEQAAGQSDVEMDIDLNRALGTLQTDYALALTLFYVEQYTIEEIAFITQVASGTVKSRLSRGRNKLKKHLERGGAYA